MSDTPKWLRGCCGIGLWALLLTPTWASWQDAVPGAQIIGTGDFSVFGFDVYNARLWSAARPLADGQPFALELIYRRSISRDDLVKASVDEIKRLAGSSLSPVKLAVWQTQMQQSFVDVQAGTRITGVYLPGQGARFFVGQQLQHEINDPQFARAFFDIWLDPRTRSPELRQQLLGDAKP
ncbi:chalcone isomerase family protein [Pseudomonas fluorescens]|uniref:Putative exported protein n=1 Tax=Pseudomonas fluorescens (strain Pf0-1) TaxID=205922 RepID=Q3KEJ3_PSEPF|nr:MULTISPECIES: chalcone isomerase family protein [Pseudomonas]ABA73813.1 putative exported protein [Pseudomonas fluorescens Pf0-1]MBX8624432.1 chalcone isomerase family protein [Pseudomonas glycinae]MBY9027438.1 chalcone isomerase family protein [Pseudomonas fluorescens]MBY9033146.1 chalcone isomerase family protein [Pseudomonas fluorescens]MBY9039159.1 chalcone isomerase family protein [Pseudomonas fluorescens]